MVKGEKEALTCQRRKKKSPLPCLCLLWLMKSQPDEKLSRENGFWKKVSFQLCLFSIFYRAVVHEKKNRKNKRKNKKSFFIFDCAHVVEVGAHDANRVEIKNKK
jgi:hypothetical protein